MEGSSDYTISAVAVPGRIFDGLTLLGCAVSRCIGGWSRSIALGGELCALVLASLGPGFLLELLRRVHASPAALAAAVTGSIVLAVVEPVIVGEFFAGSDVANAGDEDAVSVLIGLAIGIAGVIDEHRHAVAVDYNFAIADTEQISEWAPIVAIVAFGLGNAFASVFQYPSTVGYVVQRKTSGGMNVRGANDEARQAVSLPLVCSAV